MGKNFSSRIYLSGLIILFFTLFYYQIIRGDYYRAKAKNNCLRVIPIRSIRGNILDCNNVAIAFDQASFNIAVIPYYINKQKDSFFQELAQFINYDIKQIYRNYNKNRTGNFSPVDIIIDIDKDVALRLKEKFSDLILINTKPQRNYPYPLEFSAILGYVKEASTLSNLKQYGYSPLERIGRLGIEEQYDQYLRGEDGGDLIEVDSRGRMVGFVGKHIPVRGKDIQLTINARLQQIAYAVMRERRGTFIMMDSNTGEVLVLVSSPGYNPNFFVKNKGAGKFFTDPRKPLINRAIQASYPLGSTFKPIVATAALEEKKIFSYTTYTCSGKLSLGNASFKCWSTHSNENIYDALAHSCNVYFYTLGLLLGGETIARWGKKFGLDSSSGVDIPYERLGNIPNPTWITKEFKKKWFLGDTVNISIGQGYINATPIAGMLSMNVFASGGYLVRPYLLKNIAGTTYNMASKMDLKISPLNLDIVKKGLGQVVSREDGTSRVLNKLGLNIAGKTGTAQNNLGAAHGWFMGFFPYDKPKYTVCVFLENCGSSHESVNTLYTFLDEAKKENLL